MTVAAGTGARAAVSRVLRLMELALLFVAGPIVVASDPQLRRVKLTILLVMVAVAAGYAWYRRAPKSQLGLGPTGRRGFLPTMAMGLAVVIPLAVVIGVTNRLTGKPIIDPFRPEWWLWIAFPIIYTLWSFAQEYVFRAFFFWRYRDLLPGQSLVLASAVLFGWVHLPYGHWESVIFTAAGGLGLAWVFARYRSLWGVALIHAIGGWIVFFMGYGSWFYRPER